MFDFIVSNLSTILVGSGVALLLTAIAIKMIRDKIMRKSSCGLHCANCPNRDVLHTR